MAKTKEVDANGFRKVGMLDYLAYAAGDFGCNCSFALASTWLTLFYTQYMGIPALTYAGILVVLKVWDGINDPLLGGFIDSSKKKYKRGKFKTFIHYGSFGLVVSGAICFIPIPQAPMIAKIILALVGYMVWDAMYTLVNVPYGSMLATISADPGDRAQLGAWRTVGAMLASLPIGMILPLVVYDENHEIMGTHMFAAAIVLGVIGFVAFQFMLKNTIERVQIPDEVRQAKFNFFASVKSFAHNRAAVGSTLATCFMMFGMMGATTASQVMFQAYFKNTAVSGLLSLALSLPMFMVMPFLRKQVEKYGKKEASLRWLPLSIISSLVIAVAPIPPNSLGIAIFIAMRVLGSFGFAFYQCLGNAMMADAIDYGEYRDGVREEGTLYAVQSLFRKLTQGVAPSLGLVAMVAVGYNEALGAQQAADVAASMVTLVGVWNVIGALGVWLTLRFVFNLDKEAVFEMEEKLGRHVREDKAA